MATEGNNGGPLSGQHEGYQGELFASIEEEIITISIFEIGHRRDIYKK